MLCASCDYRNSKKKPEKILFQSVVVTMWRVAARAAARPWRGTIDPWALRFLVVRETDCGDWLARAEDTCQTTNIVICFTHLIGICLGLL